MELFTCRSFNTTPGEHYRNIFHQLTQLTSLSLTQCTGIFYLNLFLLTPTGITDDDIVELFKINRSLKSLTLSNCNTITGSCLAVTTSPFDKLQFLDISFSNFSSPNCLQLFPSLSALNTLNLSKCIGCKSPSTITAILFNLIWLTSLNISELPVDSIIILNNCETNSF